MRIGIPSDYFREGLNTEVKDAVLTAAKVLADVGIFQPHPCGGRGTCGKCRILLNGQPVLACQTEIHKDATIDYTDNSAAM